MSYKSLCNHYCNKNVDIFIVLVIDVFVQIIVPWRIFILLEKYKSGKLNMSPKLLGIAIKPYCFKIFIIYNNVGRNQSAKV